MLGEASLDFQEVSTSKKLLVSMSLLDIETEKYRPFQPVKPARTKSLTPDLNVKTYNFYDLIKYTNV